MVEKIQAFVSQNVVFDLHIAPAIIIVNHRGKIQDILTDHIDDEIKKLQNRFPGIQINNFGSSVLMAGLVDSHVHVNEPGRTDWEGFHTATKAAAAGGVTTIVDMPLNSIPPTTSVANLREKIRSADGNVFVDVGFWGGVVPGNLNDLEPLIEAGVVGFKCFLCPSGVEEFPQVSLHEARAALIKINAKSVLAFHAELEEQVSVENTDLTLYNTFLHSRPPSMEVGAIEAVFALCSESCTRCHIVHLSTGKALEIIADAKKNGYPITAETCPHYLTINSEDIPKNSTLFKCCPPIRDAENREKLWEALKNEILDMIVSDHSPCTPDLKQGDFSKAWGGISSLQFVLPLIWTEAQSRGLTINDISRLMSANPAKLCGLEASKGYISVGMDADFVIWEPQEEIIVKTCDILYKNKISAYEERVLKGRISSTILRGIFIYTDGQVSNAKNGRLLINPPSCQTC